MPTVSVFEHLLQTALGGHINEQSFDELCFEFGLELDEVTNEFEMVAKERGEAAAKAEGADKRTIYKVDVPANRYDLLCLEGLVKGLQIFKGKAAIPKYALKPPMPPAKMKMTVSAATAQIRPFVVCATLRNITIDDDCYQSLIELQDKLHQNICRRRTLVAIGTHDLDTLSPPFSYEALPPKDIKFVALKETKEMDASELMVHYEKNIQLKAYLPIIRDSPVYPIIYDSKRTVLSMPPIINGEHSKISTKTKNMFIECTATDLTKANIVLNTMCSMFGEYCKDKFTVEPVEVVYANDYPANTFTKPGDKIVYPAMDPRPMDANISRMKQSLGLDHLKPDEVKDLLTKMSIASEVDKKDKNILHCDIPITRSDIMHECDLIEDLAIAYGYMNLEQKIPQTLNWPAEQPVNHLTDLLRVEVAMAGFNECLNWGLISNNENFGFLRRVENKAELWRTAAQPHEYIPGAPAVEISNPKTAGFEVVRSSLLPGLLKTLAANKHNAPPIKLFEIGDAVVQEPSRETGSKNQRRVVALTAGMSADFKVIHGLLDQLMWKLDVEPVYARKADSKKRFFKLEPSEDETFMKGFQASIVIEDIVIGRIGVLHPEVVKAFEVPMPTSALEFNLEPFLEWL